MPRGRLPRKLPEAFLDKCSPEPNTGCWLWTGAYDKDGYGRYALPNESSTGAHRVALKLLSGIDTSGMVVMHTCDNPVCVNPEHLKVGTHNDNVQDRVTKGRTFSGKRSVQNTHCHAGHEFTEDNTRMYNGIRICKSCRKLYTNKARSKNVSSSV